MIHLLVDPELHQLKTRLRDLLALQALVSNEIARARGAIDRYQADRPGRVNKPACGTEQSYQWHRYHEPEHWPLPADDPCGCRQAHAEWNRLRQGEGEVA